MGVKFAREYSDIVYDLGQALKRIDHFYVFFHMEEEDWQGMDEQEQEECVKTFADDVFYALGNDHRMDIGVGHVHYVRKKHIITVRDGDNVVTVVKLI